MGKLPAQFYKGEGCNICADTGYLGRVAILEVLTVTEEVRRMLISGATADEIRKQAIKDGMVPLMHDGMLKVKDGITTVSEVLRSTFSIYY
jgi:general secretion pathway protein E